MEAGQEAPACPLEAVEHLEAAEGREDALAPLAASLVARAGLPAVAAQALEVPWAWALRYWPYRAHSPGSSAAH